nr:autotransporter outer membrane beta-barrel domain-containing protein [Mitsuokella multacida]
MTVNQNAIISNRADAADTSYQDKDFQNVDSAALLAMTNGKITLTRAQKIYGNIMADVDPDDTSEVKSTGGTIDLTTAEGGEIKGNASAGHGGTANITLAKGDWEGRATDYQGTNEAGAMNLTMQDGSIWHMKGDSSLTSLNNTSSIVDMKANGSYQTLNIVQFSGQDGTFLMKTDLDSQTDGDKVHIVDAVAGSQGRVQVYDKSFLTGKEVTGVKNLLLITDKSGKATFSGLTLDKGGLWDVTPTLQRGNTVKDAQGKIVGKETEWYLTKIAKTVNHDTKPLLGATDYAYGAYRMDIETLRQRMGELRFLNNKQDASGIWARMYGGALDGPGFDSRYHALQLGYDYAANPKSFYGWFGERGIASPHYDYGTSSNHSLAAGIYGTWFGDSGAYTDAVAKWGRDDANLHTFGPYPDQANYRTRAASLSLEYGKTMKLNDKGLFLEPQAQLVYGHLGSTHYTTAREKQVHMDDYDSFIGRVGFVFGRRTPDATKPLDYYLRLSALHEFGGRRDMHFSASDGETMDWSRDYGSTWYEASLGGTYRLNDRTTLYGDVQRSFGSDWHKKWQGNIGINWQF